MSALPPRAKIEILKTNIACRAVGRYPAVISQHRRDAYDLFARQLARPVVKGVLCSEEAAGEGRDSPG